LNKWLKLSLQILALVLSFNLGARYSYVIKEGHIRYLLGVGYLRGCVESRVEFVGKTYGLNYFYCFEKAIKVVTLKGEKK
jgi:hypothetical protein